VELVTIDDVRAARAILDGVIDPSPLERSRALSDRAGGDVFMKCENLQRTGSFKMRGAYTRIARLSDAERARGVVCASAGNHAQGVALAARLQGVDATVFMPLNAPIPKVQATTGYGARIEQIEGFVDDCLVAARAYAEEHGAILVHPFDHPDIIAGQGTVGLEIAEQAPDVRTVVVPIGGGGLISGTALALKALRPDVRVVGVQAAGASSFAGSLAAGSPQGLDIVDTIADGIAVKRPGDLTLAHVEAFVDEVVAVDDETIARAVVLLLERAKLVVEPAGAAGVAALLAEVGGIEAPAVIVLSGGNIDPLVMQHLVTDGLTAEARYATIRTRIPDRPGELARLLTMLGEERANVVTVEHHRFGRRLQLGQVEVILELETRGPEHLQALREHMHTAGYPFAAV